LEGKESGQNELTEERIPTSPFPKCDKEFPKKIFSFQYSKHLRGR
jgi:hypothetical protein